MPSRAFWSDRAATSGRAAACCTVAWPSRRAVRGSNHSINAISKSRQKTRKSQRFFNLYDKSYFAFSCIEQISVESRGASSNLVWKRLGTPVSLPTRLFEQNRFHGSLF